jgi:hypothetical protein
MTDIFAIRTPRQRQIVIGALLVYVALFGADLSTGSRLAGAGSDLIVSLLVLAACGVGSSRVSRASETDAIAVGTIAALGIAGLSIGYEGLASLDLVPMIPALETAGSLALLVALGLYFYQNYA